MTEISAMYEALDNMDDYALLVNVKPIGPHKVLTDAIAELETLRQRVAEWKEVAEENLKGMAICKQRVAELEKERDEEIAHNRPLRNLIASLEEQKSHWNKQRDEYKEAVSTMDSERSANATLTAERDALLEANRVACEDLVERHDRIVELKQQIDALVEAATMAVEMIEYNKHERRHVRWKLIEAIASVME